jgi:hypothetical protein
MENIDIRLDYSGHANGTIDDLRQFLSDVVGKRPVRSMIDDVAIANSKLQDELATINKQTEHLRARYTHRSGSFMELKTMAMQQAYSINYDKKYMTTFAENMTVSEL